MCLATFEPATRGSYRRAIELAARSAATLPADAATLRVEAGTIPRWEDPIAVLPLKEAVALLNEPLGILSSRIMLMTGTSYAAFWRRRSVSECKTR